MTSRSRWTTRSLAACGRLLSGGTPSKASQHYWNGDIPWFSSKELKSFELSDSELHVTRSGAENGSSLVPPGTVLFVVRGMSLANEFRVGLTTVPATFNQDVKGLIPSDDIDSRYLARCLRWREPQVLGSTEESSHGTKRLSAEVFENIEIPVPPLAEQRRIAGILDKADAIRRKRKEAIALTEELLSSAFLDLFGDPVTNPKGWDVKPLGEVCVLVRGSSPRPKGDSRYFGGPVPRLMVVDMTRDGLFVTPRIDSLTIEGSKMSRPVPAGTVVMAVSGNVGVAAQLEVDACIHDGFVGFRELGGALNPIYLLMLLRALEPSWATEQAGAIFQNLTTTDVKRRLVPLPPVALQEQFRRLVGSWQSLGLMQKESSKCASLLMEALVFRAFSGQLAGAERHADSAGA